MNTVNWPTGADARADALRKGAIVDWPTATDAQRDSLRRNIPPSMRPQTPEAIRGAANGSGQGLSSGVQGRLAGQPAGGTPPLANQGLGASGGATGGSVGSPGTQVKPTLRAGVAEMPRTFGKANYLAGRAAAPVVGAVTRFAPAALGGAVASQLGDYQIDDPGVDSSAAGTFRSLRDGDFAGAGRSLSKGALEAGMDLGGSVAKGVDLLTFGKAGAEQGYNNLLRGQFGDQLRIGGMPAQGPQGAPTAASVAAPTPTRPSSFRGNGFDDPRLVNADPSRGSLGPSRDFTNELASVPRELPGDLRSGVIFKTKDANGRTVYSGRDVGAGAQFVDGKGATLRGGTVSTVPGMSKEQIAEIMARPSNFNPNLTAEQNVQYNREVENAQRTNAMGRIIEGAQRGGLRGGVSGGADGNVAIGRLREFAGRDDVSLGTLRALAGAEGDYRGQNVTMRGQDINADVTMRGQDITSRGQDLNYDATVRGQDMTAATAKASALRDQANKDREFGLNLTKEQRAAREAGEKTVLERVAGMLPLTGDPAKDGAMKAQANQRLNQLYGQEINSLRKAVAANPKDKQSAAQLKMLEENGLAAFAGNEEGLLRFALGSQAADIATGDASWIPGFGNTSDSQKPVTALRYKESVLPFHKGYYVTDRTLRDGKQEEIRASQVPSDIARVLRQP